MHTGVIAILFPTICKGVHDQLLSIVWIERVVWWRRYIERYCKWSLYRTGFKASLYSWLWHSYWKTFLYVPWLVTMADSLQTLLLHFCTSERLGMECTNKKMPYLCADNSALDKQHEVPVVYCESPSELDYVSGSFPLPPTKVANNYCNLLSSNK